MPVEVDSRTAEREVRRPPFGAPHVFALAVVDGGDQDRVWRIVKPDTIIGRGEHADVDIDDQEASKQHCMIRVNGSVVMVVDMESLNGTLLNERPLREHVAHRLRHLDEIRIGGTLLLFMSGRFKSRIAD